MKKNDDVTLSITGITGEGAGVGHADGMAVFVPYTAVGDRVRAHIVKVTRSYAVGKATELLTPSEDRIESDCPSFGRCGGCVYRHLSFEAEERIKKQRVEDCLRRIGGLDIGVTAFIQAEPDGYRNKAQYPVGETPEGLQIGFFAPRSHRIVEARACRLQPAVFQQALASVERYCRDEEVSVYDERTGKGLLRHIYLRRAENGSLMVCLVVNGAALPSEEKLVERLKEDLGGALRTVLINRNTENTNVILSPSCRVLYGDGYLFDELAGVRIRLSALSFYQVNHEMAERLYRTAADFAGRGGLLLDLYCGAGTIGLSMADRFDRVVGVEVVPEAVEDARFNAAQNGIENAAFFCGDAYEAACRLETESVRPDVVVVDPPRKGLSPSLPGLIADRFSPERIVYVSCDPATLARDLALFAAHGYETRRVDAFNLFPRTAHVESVALLERKESGPEVSL